MLSKSFGTDVLIGVCCLSVNKENENSVAHDRIYMSTGNCAEFAINVNVISSFERNSVSNRRRNSEVKIS